MFNPLKITFKLDGTGVYYDPSEPIHLDSLLAWCLAPFHVKGLAPQRDETPFDIPLPLKKWDIDGMWGWHASALFPEGAADTSESLQYWRKRFRQSRIDLTKGSPSLRMGVYREYNTPLPLLLCHSMVGYAVGNRRSVRKELRRHVKYLGKKRAYGKGRVLDITVEVVSDDLSLCKDNLTMRWLPDYNGCRLVRPRPPYWNNIGRIPCAEVLSTIKSKLVNIKKESAGSGGQLKSKEEIFGEPEEV